MNRPRLLLADDHTLIRSGLKLLLEQQPNFKVVAEAEDGRQAVELVTDPIARLTPKGIETEDGTERDPGPGAEAGEDNGAVSGVAERVDDLAYLRYTMLVVRSARCVAEVGAWNNVRMVVLRAKRAAGA